MNLFTKQKQTYRHRKQTMVTKRKMRGKLGLWIKINTLLYVKQKNNRDLLYSTGNYTQNLVLTYNRRKYKKKKYIFTCN